MDNQIFARLIGPLPKKIDLHPVIIEEKDCGKYIQQKIQFFTEKDEIISAYLLLPKERKDKTPVIYCHHQHDGNWKLGKSEVVGLAGDPDMAYAQELAEKGYITFAPDAICFEERGYPDDGKWFNYFELARRIVIGQNLLWKTLFDISVWIDYLFSRPEVDAEKIGFIGHSYWGRMAIFAPVFDRRIKASVSHCGCVNYKDSIEKKIWIQMEFCVPGFLEYGDVEDVVRLVEPCSLLISGTTDDKYSMWANNIYDYAQETFKKGKLELRIYDGKHLFTEEMRNESYDFLRKYLN